MKKCKKVDSKLGLKELRAIERQLRIFLENPVHPKRCTNQQFAVYDENETYVGDVVATVEFFTKDELIRGVKKLFKDIE